ncbi:DUF1298 domain-containing protein [Halioglobus maricola]|uniref:diacylglycerol O-acyltransferase n=1 Tax=Halioglobus maricola TaxID=2601894 RepID=A0A5P9NI28_9GAMM|nr:wax ester/triacylglycerol synthase domain-containing protein [Halioglobus maricola]QFU75470.1 DUF1298 domain-containing protein [Halioglobus maricola]
MEQLNSIEHMFFDMEAGNFSLDVSSLHFYDPATAPRGKVSYQQVFNRFRAGVDAVPVLRRKLVTVPFGVDHPYWVDDAEFDLANHLEHIELEGDGDWAQLMEVVAALFARDIPRAKPLWFGAIITGISGVEGLPENGYAMFLKMHHAAIDGASGRAIQEAIHDMKPKGVRKPGEVAEWGGEEAPSRLKLLAKAYPNNLRKLILAGRAMVKAVPALVREGSANRDPAADGDSGGLLLPETVFNPKRSGGGLRIDGAMFPLADIKAMRSLAAGATLNDVVFAIIAGAMQRYMELYGDVPAQPLIAGMPMDVRGEGDENAKVMVTALMSRLYTNIDDPIERLVLTHESNKAGKDSLSIRAARPMMGVLEHTPHLALSPLIRASAWLAERSNFIPMHTLITNVPGIPVPIYLAGGRMVGLMGVVPVAGRTGLTHAVFSTPETLSITMTCDKAVMADTRDYVDCLQASYDEYLALLD